MIEEADKFGLTKWIEPFVGGANLIDKVPLRFERVGYDLNEHVIYALRDIRDKVDHIPDNIDETYYKSVMGCAPSELSSLVRFGASFGGKFDGGYARGLASNGEPRNYWAETKRNAQKQSPLIQGVEFIHADYLDLSFDDSLIYCDPPYKGTSGYKPVTSITRNFTSGVENKLKTILSLCQNIQRQMILN